MAICAFSPSSREISRKLVALLLTSDEVRNAYLRLLKQTTIADLVAKGELAWELAKFLYFDKSELGKRFLGTNMPHSGILQAIEDQRAETVGISATILFSLPKVVRLVRAIQEKFVVACPRIIFGGRAFASTPR